ncbi:ras guanine nucleotide exchange factor domain-containing protein [Mortierella sp. GBAus27b]|nr:ras guanine nucleotide exchange factor domain-containing protein [Mortierella sp. GBAus27b]
MLVSTAPGTNSVNQNGLSSPLPFEEINHPTVNHSNTSVHQGLEGPNLNRVSGDDTPTQAAIEAVELPWYLGHDYSNSDISFNRKGFVEGGTLGALVERLTLHDSFDGGFVATFMLTYRSFTTTSQLFTHLFQRFTISPPQELDREQLAQWTDRKQTPIRHRVFNIIKSWLENCFLEHEEEDHQVLSMIKEFSKSSPMRESLGFAAVQLIKLVEKREASGGMSGKTVLNLSTLAPPLPIVPRNLKRIQFMDIDPLEFARQLTIMEANCYNQIKPVDCLSKAWISTDPSIGLNIKNMIKASDLYSNWINEIVLSEKKISKRAAVIKHLIAVAVKLRQLNNFSMLVATISALARGPVHRLKRTWKQVPSRFMTALATLQDVTSPSMGWSEYRQQLQSVNLPCIPYLGLLLTDLVYVEDGYSKHLRRAAQHINFHKCVRTAEVIREIQQYQSVPYSLTSIHEIQAYIRQGMDQSKSATELYGQSLELEPRFVHGSLISLDGISLL